MEKDFEDSQKGSFAAITVREVVGGQL